MISEINPFLIEKYKQKRKEDGVSVRTINIELACLRRMFNMALKWGWARKNPLKEVKLFKEPKGKDRILSPEEKVRLFDAIRLSQRTLHLEPIVITALATGMRKSEVVNLKWPHVDLVNRLIIVEGTKSGYVRKIPMNTLNTRLTEVLSNAKKVN